MMKALDFGEKYRSCSEAMEWRRSLDPTATQADAYRVCQRGDWLIWQLTRDPAVYEAHRSLIDSLVAKMVDEAVEAKCLHYGVPEVEAWATRWLSGEDRTAAAAAWTAWVVTAASAAAAAAALAAAAMTLSPAVLARWAGWVREAIPRWPEVTP